MISGMMSFNPEEYDSWYERHRDIYEAELRALEDIVKKYPSPKLEIGVGTGRFASVLGIEYGVDPDGEMLKFAERRGIKVIKAIGEDLPFRANKFYLVLISTTLPFFKDAKRVVREAYRVLKPQGAIVIAFIPRDSYFGRKYTEMGKEGDERFRDAHFYTLEEVEKLLENLFYITRMRSTLIGEEIRLEVKDGYDPDASFVVVEGVKIQNL